ncbi:MAG: VCBS repeat-containing protein [Planctomycetota bacterium]|nr:VCBS repeat-containing protein [Planctomycetota bacterium]
MNTRLLSIIARGALALLAFVACTSVASAQTAQNTPYFNDFESSVTAGWTSTRLSNTTALGRFMGDFGLSGSTQQSTALRLNVTPGTQYTLIFDFYALRTPDGSNPTHGPDWFHVFVDGVRIFRETFDNKVWINSGWGSSMQGTYVYSPDRWGNLGFSSSDNAFRRLTLSFVPASATTTITFQGAFNQAISDEAWGIDNVRIVASTSATPFVPAFAEVSKLRTFEVRATAAATDAAGVNWADVNNDGYLDCVITGTTPRVFIYSPTTRKFTASTIVASGNFYRQCGVGDLDNDGDSDFFGMTSDTAETCVLGQGNGTFVNAGALGFTLPSTDECAVAADVNADGWLDVLMFAGNGNHLATNGGASRWPGTLGFGGSGTTAVPYVAPFNGVTTPTGLNGVGNAGDGVYVASADINDDGIPDFWYGFGGGRLFVSSPTGHTASTAIATDVNNTNKVGAAFGDFDNDGKVDLFVPAFTAGSRGKLYRGLGNGSFTDVSLASGIADTSGQRSCCWGDYNNDGNLDLYIVTRSGVGNRLYRNNGDGTFTLVDERCAAESADALDACFADYDNDGDLDLAVSVNNNTTRLYDNALDTLSPTKNFLKVRFVGSGSGATNVQGVGQRLLLLDSTGKIIARRDLGGARGIGTEPVIAHFGGVDPTKKYFVRVFSKGKAYTTPVTPNAVSTKIGANTFQQMLTITESALKPPLRITSWTEDPQ